MAWVIQIPLISPMDRWFTEESLTIVIMLLEPTQCGELLQTNWLSKMVLRWSFLLSSVSFTWPWELSARVPTLSTSRTIQHSSQKLLLALSSFLLPSVGWTCLSLENGSESWILIAQNSVMKLNVQTIIHHQQVQRLIQECHRREELKWDLQWLWVNMTINTAHQSSTSWLI